MRNDANIVVGTLAVFFIGFIFLIICIMPSDEQTQRANGYKLDNCIKLANEIGLGPNDPDRAVTIEKCYEER